MKTIEYFDKCPVCGSKLEAVTMEITHGRCSFFNASCSSSKCSARFSFDTQVEVLTVSAYNNETIEISTSSKDAHCKWNDMCDRMTRERRERNLEYGDSPAV